MLTSLVLSASNCRNNQSYKLLPRLYDLKMKRERINAPVRRRGKLISLSIQLIPRFILPTKPRGDSKIETLQDTSSMWVDTASF